MVPIYLIDAVPFGCSFANLQHHAPCQQRKKWLKIATIGYSSFQSTDRYTFPLPPRIASDLGPLGFIAQYFYLLCHSGKLVARLFVKGHTSILACQAIMAF